MIFLAYIAASIVLGASADQAPSRAIPEDIQIAAFRSEVSSHKDLVLCLQASDADPPQAVLNATAADGKTVVAGSQCEEVLDVHKGSFHKASGKPAIFLRLGGYRQIDASHVELGFVSYRHGRSAESATISL